MYTKIYHALPCGLNRSTEALKWSMIRPLRKKTGDLFVSYTEQDHYTTDEFFEHGMGYTAYSRARPRAGFIIMSVGTGECAKWLRYRLRPYFQMKDNAAEPDDIENLDLRELIEDNELEEADEI